jgi:hypothetical protein
MSTFLGGFVQTFIILIQFCLQVGEPDKPPARGAVQGRAHGRANSGGGDAQGDHTQAHPQARPLQVKERFKMEQLNMD